VKIATWNVNSIRTRLTQVQDWLEKTKPDLLCVQETKVEDRLFPKEAFKENGYKAYFHGQKSYNGVAMISRAPLQDIRIGLCGELPKENEALNLSEQKRVISCLIDGIRVINLYVPNGSSVNSEKYIYKLQWLKCLNRYIKATQIRGEQLCILGDFNIALEDRDIHSPQRLTGKIMASELEREGLKSALGENLTDVFRIFEPDANHWSWWDYRSGAWSRDRGWRIDHIYLCEKLLSQAKGCYIDKAIRGNEQPSDHAPVIVELVWPKSNEEDDGDDFLLFK